MGNLFGSTKYKETPADKALREDIERKRAEEERLKAEAEAKEKRQKKRKSKGMLGTRSLFSKSGQQGFFRDGEEMRSKSTCCKSSSTSRPTPGCEAGGEARRDGTTSSRSSLRVRAARKTCRQEGTWVGQGS